MLNNVYPSVIILHGKEQVKKCIIVQGSKIGSFLTGAWKKKLTGSFYSSNTSAAEIKVYDIAGKTIFSGTENVVKGNNSINLQLKGITAGLYNLEIKNRNMHQHVKLVIEKIKLV